jgi:hypothetical protein
MIIANYKQNEDCPHFTDNADKSAKLRRYLNATMLLYYKIAAMLHPGINHENQELS